MLPIRGSDPNIRTTARVHFPRGVSARQCAPHAGARAYSHGACAKPLAQGSPTGPQATGPAVVVPTTGQGQPTGKAFLQAQLAGRIFQLEHRRTLPQGQWRGPSMGQAPQALE